MSRNIFFIDFDATIVDSVKQFCKVYNTLYQDHPEFKQADYHNVQQYNFKCSCPLVEKPLDIFQHHLFFKDLEFINHNTYEVLEKLNKKYQLKIASIGTPRNISFKAIWLEDNIPFIKDYVLMVNDGCKMNKSIINMENAIFLDDIPSNLKSSNAKIKFLFGKLYTWNKGWTGKHCFTWSDIEERFLL